MGVSKAQINIPSAFKSMPDSMTLDIKDVMQMTEYSSREALWVAIRNGYFPKPSGQLFSAGDFISKAVRKKVTCTLGSIREEVKRREAL